MARHLALALTVAAALACPAGTRAQAIAQPNQIQGVLELTNVNPDVLAYVDAPGNLGLSAFDVTAETPLGYPQYHASTDGLVDSRLRAHFELTVETSSTGLPYEVTPEVWLEHGYLTVFPVTSDPVFPEPAPDVPLAFRACLGILRLHFRDASGAPCPIVSGAVGAGDESGHGTGAEIGPGMTDVVLAVRSNAPLRLRVVWTTGTDSEHDLIQHVVDIPGTVTVPCDEIVDLDVDCLSGDGSGGTGLGRIVGEVDVLGADEIQGGWSTTTCTTQVKATGGPQGNRRYDCLRRTPSSGSFELENLLPPPPGDYSTWDVSTTVFFDWAGYREHIEWPEQTTTVRADETTDLGDLFVMHPGVVRQEVSLVGPPSRPPGFASMLADLARPGSLSFSAYGSWVVAPGASRSANDIDASTLGGGVYDASAERFEGSVELITGGWHGESSLHDVGGTSFSLSRSSTDPDTYHSAHFGVSEPELLPVLVVPGATADFAHDYCVGELRIGVHSTGAAFHSPSVHADGRLAGRDFLGRVVDRGQGGNADGTPEDAADASVDGQILLALPEGQYTFSPRATFMNPGGGSSYATFREFDLDVGCRQVVKATPETQLQVTSLPPCLADRTRVEGSASSIAGIASITWQVDGGAPTILCTDCGPSRGFSFFVDMPDRDAEIVVRAVDGAGAEAEARSFTKFSREPSAGDLRPAARPLTLAKSGDRIRLEWEDLGADANVFRGTLASLHVGRTYDHREAGACAVAGGSVEVPMPSGSVYFVVGGACDWGSGTLGRDSFGRSLPPGWPGCD